MKKSNQNTHQRPAIITIFCVISFIVFGLSIFALPSLLDLFADSYEDWYVPYWIVSALLTLVSIIGYWQMRKWGVYLYTALFVIGSIIGLILSLPFTFIGVVVPLIIITIGLYYLKRMQ